MRYQHTLVFIDELSFNAIRVFAFLQDCSVFFFEKKVAEKLHKPKRKETITEILRFGVRQLERHKHPKLLSLAHPIEEAK